MEERVLGKPYEVSERFEKSRDAIYDYSIETFGIPQAERYWDKIHEAIEKLPLWYSSHSECRHLQTKSKMYRNIILDSHLIIFRITEHRIEVLDIVHSASSVGKIRKVRSIRIS